MSERFRIIVAYVLICLIWGSTWLVIRIGLESMTPFLSAGIRFVIAATVLFVLIKWRDVAIPWTRESILLYLLVALFSFSIPFACVYWGQQYVPSGLSSILFAVYPFAVALFSVLLLRQEKITIWKMLGMIAGFIGTVIIFLDDMSLGGPNFVAAMFALVGSAVLQAFSLIMIKRIGQAIHPFSITFIPMLISAMILLALSGFYESFNRVTFSATAIASLIYLGILGSVVTFVSYFWLLKRVEPVFLSLTAFVTPILAVILGTVVYGEELSSKVLFGALFVLAGILIANAGDIKLVFVSRKTKT